MFVETYRFGSDSIMLGGDARAIPYPKMTDEDWRAWRLFLPFHSETIDRSSATKESLYFPKESPTRSLERSRKLLNTSTRSRYGARKTSRRIPSQWELSGRIAIW